MAMRVLYLILGMAIGGGLTAFVLVQMMTANMEASRHAFPSMPMQTATVI